MGNCNENIIQNTTEKNSNTRREAKTRDSSCVRKNFAKKINTRNRKFKSSLKKNIPSCV